MIASHQTFRPTQNTNHTQNAAAEWEQTQIDAATLPDLVYQLTLSPNLRSQYVNAAIVDLTGYTPQEICGCPQAFLHLFHPESAAEFLHYLRNPRSNHFTAQWITRDQQTIWVDLHSRFTFDDNGNLLSLEGTAHDVTAYKTAQQTEREGRLLANAMLATSEALISIKDLDAVLECILNQLETVIAYRTANIMLIEDEIAHVVRCRGYSDEYVKHQVMHRSLRVSETNTLNLMTQTQQPLLVEDTYQFYGWRFDRPTMWIRSYIGAPIQMAGQVIGFINLDSDRPHGFTAQHLNRLEAFANQAALAINNTQMIHALQRSREDLKEAYHATLQGWARALELRDHETQGHTQRVTEMVMHLARKMDIPESQQEAIHHGAQLHDIGKMGIPDNILLKRGALNEEEWRVMKMHPTYAHIMLSSIDYLRPCLDIPLYHHERWDGSGYPFNLRGKEIPLAARLFAVVDVWEALSSNRPYRLSWPPARIINYLRDQAGLLFDPDVVQAFLELLKEQKREEKIIANTEL